MTTRTVPGPGAADRVRQAVRDRPATDYEFDFWTAFGWTVLTLGVFAFYVFYQLVRRSREHNRRRIAILDAAMEESWQRASASGRTDELQPAFQQIRADVEQLRRLDGDLRDPTLWLLFSILGGGLVWTAGAILLDHDLQRHERYERAAEDGLTRVFTALGVSLPAAVPASKGAHNYVGRIIATVFTLGLYSLWWVADLMREGNANYRDDNEWEDALAAALAHTP